MRRGFMAMILGGAAVLLTTVAGCGQKGPALGQVRGRVTLDGEPLAEAEIVFQPQKGRPGTARTNDKGEYELTYTVDRAGALLGLHEIRITTFEPGYDGETPQGERKTIPERPERVPAKYNRKSELKADVKPGSNVFDFQLSSK